MYIGINLFLISIPLGPQISPLAPSQLLCSLEPESRREILTLKAVLHAQVSSKDVKSVYIDKIKTHTRLLVFIVQETLKKP